MTNQPHTRIEGKEHSPLVIRRYSMPFLHFVCIISDDDLDILDNVVLKFWDSLAIPKTIQDMRNHCGSLTETVITAFPRTEGCGVIYIADKLIISSLVGDMMNHAMCRDEIYFLLNLATGV